MAYFNALPSFANPQIAQGVLFTQDSYDVRNKVTDILLELRPTTRIVPYFEYQRNGGSGQGVMNTVANFNEYPVSTLYDSSTNLYRGGVHFELSQMHLTLEGGGTQFHDNQLLVTGNYNAGNRTTPYLGETLFLDSVQQQLRHYRKRSFPPRAVHLPARRSGSTSMRISSTRSRRTESTLNYMRTGNFTQINPILFYTKRRWRSARRLPSRI